MLTYRVLQGGDLEAALDDVAGLRITVFRDWPYLYDGNVAYERDYLNIYRNNDTAILVGAFDGDRLVGASTGTPLAQHADEFGTAFADTGHDPNTVFYCAESVLLPAYRRRGAGHKFFDLRESHARDLGFETVCFCGVVRPENHPLRPADYRPLDSFWRARGYEKLPGAMAEFTWKDIDQSVETKKQLQFWIRRL